MYIVSTTSLAVYSFILLRIQLVVADGTLALDGFAISVPLFAGLVVAVCLHPRNERRILDQLAQLGTSESKLIRNILSRLENSEHDIDDVLALIAFMGVWAVAARCKPHVDSINISSGASDDDLLLRKLICAAAFARKDCKTLCECSILDFEVGAWCVSAVSAETLLFWRLIVDALGLLTRFLRWLFNSRRFRHCNALLWMLYGRVIYIIELVLIVLDVASGCLSFTRWS